MASHHSLGVTVSGTGPALVLVHGLFGDRRNLGAIARPLSERFEVHSLDLPNHGDSLRLEPGSIEQLADALSVYIRALNSPVHYIGHSLGGKVGFGLVTRYPDLMRSFVALDIAPVAYHRPDYEPILAGLAAIDQEQPDHRRQADERLKAFVPELPVRQFLLKSFIPLEQRAENNHCWIFQREILSTYFHLITAAPRFERSWQGPALVISGEKSDYVSTMGHEDALVQWLPNVKRQTVEGAGHWLHAEKTQTVVSGIEGFLTSFSVS